MVVWIELVKCFNAIELFLINRFKNCGLIVVGAVVVVIIIILFIKVSFKSDELVLLFLIKFFLISDLNNRLVLGKQVVSSKI